LQIGHFFSVTVIVYCKTRKSIFSKANFANPDGESIILKFYREIFVRCSQISITTSSKLNAKSNNINSFFFYEAFSKVFVMTKYNPLLVSTDFQQLQITVC